MIRETINFSAALGSALNQGNRPTCLAFASSDFNRYANGLSSPLSVEYLCHSLARNSPDWQPNQGFGINAALISLRTPGQPEDSAYPYLSAEKATPLNPAPSGLAPLYTSNSKKQNLSTDEVLSRLSGGAAVALIVQITKSFFSPVQGIVEHNDLFIPNQLHALLGVGIGEHIDTKEIHVLIRNSWGTAWGKNGHAWISRQYLDTHLRGSFAL
jgi:hypothetical protein